MSVNRTIATGVLGLASALSLGSGFYELVQYRQAETAWEHDRDSSIAQIEISSTKISAGRSALEDVEFAVSTGDANRERAYKQAAHEYFTNSIPHNELSEKLARKAILDSKEEDRHSIPAVAEAWTGLLLLGLTVLAYPCKPENNGPAVS